MKTQKEYTALHAALENSRRVMEGCFFAFAHAGHQGLASFAVGESRERGDMAMQITRHLISHNIPVTLPALPAPVCDYPSPVHALQAMCNIDMVAIKKVTELKNAMVNAGEDTYFVIELRDKMECEYEELRSVNEMLSVAKTPEEMKKLNILLINKYA